MIIGFLDPVLPVSLDVLKPALSDSDVMLQAEDRSMSEMIRIMTESDFVITGDVGISEIMFIEGANSRLKAVHKWGVGYDNIDVISAKRLGIPVLRTTGSNAKAVAETTLSLMLSLTRNVAFGHMALQQGNWIKGELGKSSVTLSGKSIGLVGLGYIGKAVAQILKGFDCKVYYFKNNRLSKSEEEQLGVNYLNFDELLEKVDVLSLHCSLNNSTRSFMNHENFGKMKKGALFINTARGELVDESELLSSLKEGSLAGAALDVFCQEPLPVDHLFSHSLRIITTPHVGAIDCDSYLGDFKRMIANFTHIESGTSPNPIDIV